MLTAEKVKKYFIQIVTLIVAGRLEIKNALLAKQSDTL